MVRPEEFREMVQGVSAIMVTPLSDEGEISPIRMESHVNHLVCGGLVNGKGLIVTTGSMGECGALSWEERRRVLSLAVEAAAGRVPVVAGSNGTNVREVVEFARYAQDVGAAGIMLLSPYYFRPPAPQVVDYFRTVADSIDLGIMLYNNSHIVRQDLPIDLILRLAEIDNVVAIKECTPDFFKFIELVRNAGDRIAVLNGNAEFWEPCAKLVGAVGFVSGVVNFAPQITMQMWELREQQDYAAAWDLRMRLAPLLEFWMHLADRYGPSIEASLLKHASLRGGSPVGRARLPVPPLSEEEETELDHILEEIGIVG